MILMKIHIDKKGIMISEETDEVIKELFKSLLSNCQKVLENKKATILSLIALIN